MIAARALRAVFALAPVKWDRYATRRRTATDHLQMIGELDGIAIRAVRLSVYLSARWHGGRNHAEAVREQNKAIKHVRRALGYAYLPDTLNF